MSGGYHSKPRQRCARRLATGLLGGLLTAYTGVGDLCADDILSVDEQSIVVENGTITTVDPDVALVTDQSGEEALEPIANVSEYEPELADDVTAADESLEPTLADPPETVERSGVAPRAAGTPDRPAADDVCIEDEVVVITDDDEAPAANEPFQAASFNGVTPGVTTRSEVLESWGEPADADVTAETLTYQLEGFPTIAIRFARDSAESIRVALAVPANAETLVAKLGLTTFRATEAQDETGALVSSTYPERGVTLNHAPNMGAMASDDAAVAATLPEDAVYEIVVQPIKAAAFIERAESCADNNLTDRLADLETALELEPQNARICFLLSQLKLTIGQAVAAEKLAAHAVKFEGDNDEYRVQWAKCLKQLARYEPAVEQTRKVLEGTTASQIVRAQALEQMGLLAALGSKEVQERAIPLHNKAIELADKLAATDDPAVQKTAHEVLLSAHLAVAERIAAGNWQQKDKFVGQWIGRASALAEQMISAGEADLSLRLRVAVSALVAGGRLSPPVDPKLWVAEAEQAVTDLDSTLKDKLAKQQLDWQLGVAYSLAAEIQHRRGESALAIEYGELADGAMTPLAQSRAELPDTGYALGRLYFQIGAVHAVHEQDHEAACQWYDRASELLMKPVPMTTLASPGQHGDALVSMGVSYWEVGQRERAYELTEAGVELADQGVAEGLLTADALSVPQGNLNAMARALGKVKLATPVNTERDRAQVAESNGQNAKATAKRPNRSPQSRVADRRATTGETNVRRR